MNGSMGVKNYFGVVEKQFQTVFTPHNFYVELDKRFQLQLPFKGSIEKTNGFYHVKMGLFYELVTLALFGGELFDVIKDPEKGDVIKVKANCNKHGDRSASLVVREKK